MINVENLKPFPKFCYTIGMIPSSYKQSLSYEEQLMWFCDFLENTVIPTVNNNGRVVEELQNLFVELKNYVDDYFNNLDVQEEINEKLDEMAESGELEEIIALYLNSNGIITFNTVNDMIASEILVEGSTVRTLGKLNYNDGNGRLYKIEHIISANPDGINLISLNRDDLYARLIVENYIIEAEKNKTYVNVVKNGVLNNGNDTSQILQDLFELLGGQSYFFPNGTYYFENIEIPSNSRIIGEKNTKFIIPNDELNSNFKLINKENIAFENCYFSNGTEMSNGREILGSIGVNQKACIYAYNSNIIKINNCIFDNMFWGLLFHKCNNNIIQNSQFLNCGYEDIGFYGNCDNNIIENCLFDKVFSNTSNNSYMIALSETEFNSGTSYPTNTSILNNTFKNNEVWEAVDSHGSNFTNISNNKFYNCFRPIVLLNDERFVNRNLKMKGIIIDNNFIDLNNISNAGAILVNGSANASTLSEILATNIQITNNQIINGMTVDRFQIQLYYCENFIIKNNIIESDRRGLNTYRCIYGDIIDNIFKMNPYCMYINNSHLINVKNNIFKCPNIENYINNLGNACNIWLENNTGFYNTYLFSSIGNMSKFATYGKPILNLNTLLPTNEVVTSKNVSHKGDTDTTSSITASTIANSDIITTNVNMLDDLSPLQNIKIAGAGSGGSDLTCILIEYLGNKQVRINTPALTTVDNATITKIHYTNT